LVVDVHSSARRDLATVEGWSGPARLAASFFTIGGDHVPARPGP
jgi:hypothetical protein